MLVAIEFWVAVAIGMVPLVGCILWWWNDIRYALPVVLRCAKGGGSKLPPGYMGVPFLGEMLHFLYYFKFIRRPDDYIDAKRNKYGDGAGLYRTHLFGNPTIIAWTGEANRFIFKSETNFLLNWPAVEIVGTNSLVVVQGGAHARIRNMVVKAINQPDALRRIAATVQPRIVASLESWAQKGRVFATVEAKKVTFENIGKFFAGLEPGPHLDELDKNFAGILQGVRSHPINLPGTAYRHALQCRKKATEIFRTVMEKHRKNGGDAASAQEDLLSGLMRLKDDEGKHLRDEEVLDNIVSLVVAGYESTSLSIMWALHYLAQSPTVLEKLREEHMPFKNNGRFIASDEITKLPYTNKVVEETIRLANIASIIFRTASKDVNYQGYVIPKGWTVICWVRYLHTNPENFDDPMTFNPDRWDKEAKLGTYLPFGGGSRICAGNMLARLQVSLFIHHLVTGYRWELVNPKAEIIYLPHRKPVDGLEINISKI